ncbi:MerR family transcriptional regulator [Spirochaeta cellobiosiphila]|uniref:MerR family transcriptional regulator n=1 Tax=Spirochaeta cellobiosiphila TaxID=504483 RepID=UPI0003F58AF9|nr:MerR family transcriptional regulator [Spirochaeta cellobiosiphila]
MNIGELAQKAGVSKDTLRYYEKLGLLGEVERGPNSYRDYSERYVATVQVIKRSKDLGFTLREIKTFLDGIMSGSMTFRDFERTLQEKIDEIEGGIASLWKNLAALKGIQSTCPKGESILSFLD